MAKGEVKNNEMTSRQRLAERYRSRNPELNVDDDEALGAAILGDLDAYDQNAEKIKRFNETVQSNEIAPGLLSGILSGKNTDGSQFDLVEYILDNHMDFFLDYIEDHEGAKAKMQARREARKAEADADAALEEQAKAQLGKEDAELDAAIQEMGYKPEQVADLIDYIYNKDNGLIKRAANFELTKDDFLRLFKMKDYDLKMTEAEDRGYKRGRNEKIDMFHHEQKKRDEMPADIDNGGVQTGTDTKDPYLSKLDKMKGY